MISTHFAFPPPSLLLFPSFQKSAPFFCLFSLMEDDWDLHAVVRGCSATTSTTTASCNQLFTNLNQDFNFGDGGLFEPRRSSFIEESLQDLYRPFFTNPQTVFSPQTLPVSPLSVVGGFKDLSTQQHQQRQQRQQPSIKQPPQQSQVMGQNQQSLSLANVSKTKPTASSSHNPSPRSKRRKNHVKRVCQVPGEKLSSDMWSWRKYGQKPIKGSPYPRGYYRCSTLKGCMARKQVERNRSDPGMFIVTYTAEHNHPMPTHRNSLAGSTRQKTVTPNSDDLNKPVLSPVMSPEETLSPAAAEKLESSREDREEDLAEAEEEDDDFCVSNVVLDDDFFAGLEDFVGPTMGDCLSDHFPANIQFPWLANNATTTAAGGG